MKKSAAADTVSEPQAQENGHEIQHGDHHRTTSSFAAFLNVVCVVAGAGTLGLPFAVKEGGWISLSFFVLTSFVSIYTSKLLIECLYYKEGQRLEQFPDIGEAAFGMPGRYLAKVFSYGVSLSSPCIYILLTGKNIFAVLKQSLGYEVKSIEFWVMISGIIVLIPFVICKTLKEVAILGFFGTFSTIFVVFCVAIKGGIDYGSEVVHPETQPINFTGLANSLAIIAFAYGGSVVYPHVESTMKHPKSWNKVVFYGVAAVSFMYILIGITGYLYYGINVKSVILDSLPESGASITVYILITLHVVVAAPIFLCSFALEQEKILKIDTEHLSPTREFLFRSLFRSSIVVILTLIAMYVPYFNVLTGIAGSIANCATVFLIPVICHYKLYGWRQRSVLDHIFSSIVIILGVFGMIVGTISVINDGIKNKGN